MPTPSSSWPSSSSRNSGFGVSVVSDASGDSGLGDISSGSDFTGSFLSSDFTDEISDLESDSSPRSSSFILAFELGAGLLKTFLTLNIF